MPSSGFAPPLEIVNILLRRNGTLEPEEIVAVQVWLARDCFRWMIGVCQSGARLKDEDAEEVVQDVLLRIPAILRGYKPGLASFQNFLWKCIVNGANEWWRKNTVRKAETDLPAHVEIRAPVLNPETHIAVQECLSTLDENERVVMTMTIYGYSDEQIASIIHRNTGRVRVIRHYARLKMKGCLNGSALNRAKGQS